MAHAAPESARDVLGHVGRPATKGCVPLVRGVGHLDGTSDALIALGNVSRAAAAGAVVGAVDVLDDVALANASSPVVVALVVLHDSLVLGHLVHLLVFVFVRFVW